MHISHLGVGAAGARDLDGLGAAIIGLVHHELHLLALCQRAEAIGDNVGLRKHQGWSEQAERELNRLKTRCGRLPGVACVARVQNMMWAAQAAKLRR
jgi:hypothetical protein